MNCPVCEESGASEEDEPGLSDGRRVACGRCGPFRYAPVAVGLLRELDLPGRLALSRAIRWGNDRGGFQPCIDKRNLRTVSTPRPPPTDVVGQLDELLLLVAEFAPYAGRQTGFDEERVWAARLALPLAKDVVQLGGDASPQLFSRNLWTDGKAAYSLTTPGWQRVRELRRSRPDAKQVFVAMWFDASVEAAWSRAIKPTIEGLGLSPYKVDLDPGHEKIDDKIMGEIRRSRALVADLTGSRGGVYFEAGFALGLGLPVIFTCREDWFKERHFDVEHYPFIAWKDEGELAERLEWRFRASGLADGAT